MFKVPEKYRIRAGAFGSHTGMGNNGAFVVPISSISCLCCIASDGMGWEHVSVHKEIHTGRENKTYTPSWDEMCKIKNLFWDDTDCVIQFHPPKSDYINTHDNVLHLWREVGINYKLPEKILV